jgi:hypothetical protein
LEKLAEACLRWTPQIAIRKNEAVFLEVSKSFHLFSEESLKSKITVLAKRFGMKIRITSSHHPCFALAKSHFEIFHRSQNLSDLPLEAFFCFLNPFELELEKKKEIDRLIHFLHQLGIHTVQEFLQIPRASLGSRWGSLAIQIHSTRQGEFEWPWKGFFPSPRIKEVLELGSEDLEGTEVTLEPLLFSLKSLIDRAMARLIGQGRRASKVRVDLQLAPWSTLKVSKKVWDFSFSVAQGTSVFRVGSRSLVSPSAISPI